MAEAFNKDELAFLQQTEELADILCDLDEWGRPKKNLPNCPQCGEDELGIVHPGWMTCYSCNWELRSNNSVQSIFRCDKCGRNMVHTRLKGYVCKWC